MKLNRYTCLILYIKQSIIAHRATSSEFPGCNLKLVPMCRGLRQTEKRGRLLQMVGCRFNKQGNLHMRLVLGNHKVSRPPHLPARILKVYTEALTGFSHIYHPHGLNTTLLSEGCVLGQLLTWGWQTKHTFQGQGRSDSVSIAQVKQQSCPLNDLPQLL